MNSIKEYTIVIADTAQRQAIYDLLRENDLPVVDLDETKILVACLYEGNVIGTGGLQVFKDCALLRSVSIKKELQKKGLGKFMVEELEKIAKQKRINCLYLLTTSAQDFFTKKGYNTIDREKAPNEIRDTSEFSSVCPSTAVLMRKRLT